MRSSYILDTQATNRYFLCLTIKANVMKNLILVSLMALFMQSIFISCKKGLGCYDAELHEKHKNDFCTADCPGVRGCDGKVYCNECEAAKKGIRVLL